MGVDHGGGDVLVAQEFLDGADVRAAAQKVGGKGMAQSMRGGGFLDAGFAGGLPDGALEERLAEVMAAHGLAARVDGEIGSGKGVLRDPFAGGAGVFAFQGAKGR